MASVCGRSKGRGAPPRACYDARGHGRDEFARQLRASAPPCGPRGPPWQIATLLNTGVPLTSRALGNPGLLRRAGRALVHRRPATLRSAGRVFAVGAGEPAEAFRGSLAARGSSIPPRFVLLVPRFLP